MRPGRLLDWAGWLALFGGVGLFLARRDEIGAFYGIFGLYACGSIQRVGRWIDRAYIEDPAEREEADSHPPDFLGLSAINIILLGGAFLNLLDERGGRFFLPCAVAALTSLAIGALLGLSWIGRTLWRRLHRARARPGREEAGLS